VFLFYFLNVCALYYKQCFVLDCVGEAAVGGRSGRCKAVGDEVEAENWWCAGEEFYNAVEADDSDDGPAADSRFYVTAGVRDVISWRWLQSRTFVVWRHTCRPATGQTTTVTSTVTVIITKGWKVKGGDLAFYGKPISKLRSVTCHMESHSVTCHSTQVNAPRVNPSQID